MHLDHVVRGLKRSSDSYGVDLKLGRQSLYAIDGLLVLARKPFGTVMMVRDIAEAGGVPENFLAKILQKLTRNGVLVSSRGAVRGYALARKAKEIKVRDIFLAVEGKDLFDRCIFWSERCADSDPCPLHFQWKRIRERLIRDLMDRTTLGDLSKR
jgi:Rrf2 family transcriptional regulator, iron-sulfur cluster assembly transcription factor